MEENTNTYEEIYDYLKQKYKRATIGKKELAHEMGIALSTLDLYMSKGLGLPPYKKVGSISKNARVIFNINSVARFLSEDEIKTM